LAQSAATEDKDKHIMTLLKKRNTKWVQLQLITIQTWYLAESYCKAGPASFWPCDKRGKHWTVTQ